MKRPIFYFAPLSTWDILTILFYTALSIFVFFIYNGNFEFKDKGVVIFGYAIVTQLFIYFFNYKSLQNFTVYLVWLGYALLHLMGYFYLKDDPLLITPTGNSAIVLRNTIILLFLYQLLRIISVNIQGQEFVAPSRGRKDIFGERLVNIIDYLLFLIYLLVTIVLIFWH